MKPFHAGLLMIAAALAGGLVVKMTQGPAPIVAVQAPAKAAVAPAAPAPVPAPKAVEEAPKPSPVAKSPAKAHPQIARTNPIGRSPEPYQPPAPAAPTTATPEPPAAPAPEVAAAEPPKAPEPAPQADPEPPAPPAPPPAPRQVTLRTGTSIAVRFDESLSSDRKMAGDTFSGSLADPIVADGLVIAERGAHVTGRITDVRKAGRLSGTSMLQLELSSITTADGQRIGVYSEPWSKQGESGGRGEAATIGGGAALGAIIGAIAGGGKGAAIGAGAGGVAGTGAAAVNGGKPVNVPSETVIRFRLASSVTITERQW